MKACILVTALLLCAATSLSASAWKYPADGATVGNPTYFDCQAPITPNYMKLWIHGSSTPIWTVHGTNRLQLVYFMSAGTYTMNCQYDDGSGVVSNFITITVGNNLYDRANVDDESYSDPGSDPFWRPVQGCGGACTMPFRNSALDTNISTDGQSRYFSANINSSGGDYQDVFFYEKRCGGSAAIGNRGGHYMVNFNAYNTAGSRALEWGFSQWYGGRQYRMVFQANYPGGNWRVYDIADGQWHDTNVTLGQAPVPTGQFKRVYLVGHPFTDGSGNERVSVDLIQIGECTNAPCSDYDSDPILPVPITSVSGEPSNSVGTVAGSCYPGTSEGNSQSLQIDLDKFNYTAGKIWTDKYWVHILP